jgi:hypothetical protein
MLVVVQMMSSKRALRKASRNPEVEMELNKFVTNVWVEVDSIGLD